MDGRMEDLWVVENKGEEGVREGRGLQKCQNMCPQGRLATIDVKVLFMRTYSGIGGAIDVSSEKRC